MTPRVKVCGITRMQDAETAVEAGADALGFVLWNGSPRRVLVADVMRIALELPPYVSRVGVFVNEARPILLSALRNGRLNVAQLHGEEEPAFGEGLDTGWYRVFKVAHGDDPARLAEEIGMFDSGAYMLDTRMPGAAGGTGRTFDWGLAAEIGHRVRAAAGARRRRMILAGGLTAGNVGEAIRVLSGAGLWAVDVSSSVEASPGVKDPELVRRFIDSVQDAA